MFVMQTDQEIYINLSGYIKLVDFYLQYLQDGESGPILAGNILQIVCLLLAIKQLSSSSWNAGATISCILLAC